MVRMTQEERLALRLKTYKAAAILNAFGVRYLVRRLGMSPLKIARMFRVTTGGSRELGKLAFLFLLRDIVIASPAIIVLLYTLFK